MARSKKPRKSRQRSSAHYLAYVDDLARVYPRLKKYKRRKRLKPQEKSAIQRAINSLKKERFTLSSALPVDAKAWRHVPKAARYKGGIRAIYRPHNVTPPAVMKWLVNRKWGKRMLTVNDAAGRRWTFVPCSRDDLQETALKIYRMYPNRLVQIDVWVTRGLTDWTWAAKWDPDNEDLQERIKRGVERQFGTAGAGYQNMDLPEGFDPIIGLKYFVQ